MNLLVLGHIRFIAEVVEVASVGLGVKFRNKRSSLRSKSLPINLSKILMLVDVLDKGKTLCLGCDTAVSVSRRSFPTICVTNLVMKFQVRLLMK